MLPSHLTRNGMQEEEICARVLNLSLCKLKETGFHYAALKISPCCTALNLNDFRKHLFLDVFLHFVILIACKVDRIWPDFKKGILFGKKKLHIHRLYSSWEVAEQDSQREFFSLSVTLLTSHSRLNEYERNCSARLLSFQPWGNYEGAGSIYDPDS